MKTVTVLNFKGSGKVNFSAKNLTEKQKEDLLAGKLIKNVYAEIHIKKFTVKDDSK